MSDKQVVVYGASGYTGKLIAWHLAEANIPFIAAGRNAERLQEQMEAVPECSGHDYECVSVDHTAEDLAALFKGKKVVYNVVGPFMQLGEPVVQAALEAGCNYFDTTGETDWMMYIRDKYGEAFQKKGLILCPATSYMWTSGLLAAEIALESPGVDSLDIVYLADSDTSVASTKSFLRMCTKPQHYLERGEMKVWPYATAYDVCVPDHHATYQAVPWSGGGETVWYEHDSRVNNCTTLVAFKNREMFGAILGVLVDFEEKYRDLPADEQEEVTNQIGGAITTEEPGREDPNINRQVTSCIGRGNAGGVRIVMRGNSPYRQTGALAAEACRRVLLGSIQADGFVSPAKAFGARELAAALSAQGYLDWESSSF